MRKNRYSFFTLLLLSFFMGSCQLNDSLKVLIEGEKVTINKPVEKKLERNNSIKPKKKY